MGEKEIAPGSDTPKPDPRGGGPQGGQGQGGQGGSGQGGPGGPGGPGQGGDPSPRPGGSGWTDPIPPRPQPQQIITGKKKKTEQSRPLFPQPGRGGKHDG